MVRFGKKKVFDHVEGSRGHMVEGNCMGRAQKGKTLFSLLCVSPAMRQKTALLRLAAGSISRPEGGLSWLTIRVSRMGCVPRLFFRSDRGHGFEEYLGRNRCELTELTVAKAHGVTSKVLATEITRSEMIGRRGTPETKALASRNCSTRRFF